MVRQSSEARGYWWQGYAYLEVEAAWFGGVLELGFLGALLEEGIELETGCDGQHILTDGGSCRAWDSSRATRCNSERLPSHTSRSSSSVGLALSFLLSAIAVLNLADWVTMAAVFPFGGKRSSSVAA